MSGVLLVLGGVAVRLPLLDADAHGKGLSLHGDAPAVEQLKGVPGGVTGAEDQLYRRAYGFPVFLWRPMTRC